MQLYQTIEEGHQAGEMTVVWDQLLIHRRSFTLVCPSLDLARMSHLRP